MFTFLTIILQTNLWLTETDMFILFPLFWFFAFLVYLNISRGSAELM
jgi:hypothetical protein